MKTDIKTTGSRRGPILWSVIAVLLSFGVLAVFYHNIDRDRIVVILQEADTVWILMLVMAFPLEQVVRAWKWRHILFDIQPIATATLFGAVMAGYFANMVVPVGISPLVRAWLVARLKGLQVSTVLVTTAIERFVDGVIFALIVGGLLVFATLPDVEGNLRLGLMVSGGISLVLFLGLFGILFRLKDHFAAPSASSAPGVPGAPIAQGSAPTAATSIITRSVARLEKAFGGKFAGLGSGMAAGIIWPRSRWRSLGVIGASITMKLIATTHFFWVGLAFGVVLLPFDYLLIMVISGFAMIITRFIRLPGGSVIGSAFALKILGVADEQALAMVLVVHTSSWLVTALIGAAALWKSGLTVMTMRKHFTK